MSNPSDIIHPFSITDSKGFISDETIVFHNQKKNEARKRKLEESVENPEDGYKWFKYGQKRVKGSFMIRAYYRCGNFKLTGCPAKKTVDNILHCNELRVTYEFDHNHPPMAPPVRHVVTYKIITSHSTETNEQSFSKVNGCSLLLAGNEKNERHSHLPLQLIVESQNEIENPKLDLTLGL